MLRTLAVENYRSLQHLVIELAPLTVVTGANGSGKSNLYRALRLLSEIVRAGALSSLAAEGGLRSALHVGDRDRGAPVALRLGFAADELSYAIDLGLPQPGVSPFPLDPEVKSEAVWSGEILRPSTIAADRRSLRVRVRSEAGDLQIAPWSVTATESMLATLADPDTAPELYALRERARSWRFYDSLRTDPDAPARRPGPATFTPALSGDGGTLPGALATLLRIGNAEALQRAVGDAFDGAQVEIDEDDRGIARVAMRHPGVRRSFEAAELSDGTLRFLLLATALLAPRPPGRVVRVTDAPRALAVRSSTSTLDAGAIGSPLPLSSSSSTALTSPIGSRSPNGYMPLNATTRDTTSGCSSAVARAMFAPFEKPAAMSGRPARS